MEDHSRTETTGHAGESEPISQAVATAAMDSASLATVNERAEGIIRQNTLISLGIGLIPIPGLDVAALLGQQLYMIRNLGRLYDQDFTTDLGQKAILSLLSATLPHSSLKYAAFGMLKVIPLIGPAIALLTQPLLAGTMTYAIGQVFNKHFATGGTLLSFDPVRHKAYFDRMMVSGQEFVRSHQKTASAAPHPEASHPEASHPEAPHP